MREHLDFVLSVVSDCFGITPEDIKGRQRVPEFVYARRFVFVFIKQKYPIAPLKQVGELLNRNHATVIHSFKQHRIDTEMIQDYSDMFNRCSAKINKEDQKTHRELINSLEDMYAKRIGIEKKIVLIQEQLNDLD